MLQTKSLPKGFLRQPYHFKLEAQGGILPLKWEVTAGTPPPGIDLSPRRHPDWRAHRGR